MITESEYTKITELAHRKKYAQFFTPEPISDFMAEWVLSGSEKHDVLEPAYGLGVFSRSMLRINRHIEITGYEIDKHILTIAQDNLRMLHEQNVCLHEKDYITASWSNRYDAVICNPPYQKFHDYNNGELVPVVNDHLQTNLSMFTNLYSLFLMKSLSQLRFSGRCAYIIPSEFMNSDYGVEVKRHLLHLNVRLHFIVVNFEENVFDKAITTACIVLCEKLPADGFIRFSLVNDVGNLQNALLSYKEVPLEAIKAEAKWKNYYGTSNSVKYKYLIDFSTYAKVSRGIATGANSFYTFSEKKAKQYSIPQEALQKCVCHGTDIDKTIFTMDDFQRLAQNNKTLYLFNGVGNESVQSVSDYISMGEKEGVKLRYLCQSRKPWYSLEKRVPAPIWVSVFNRKRLRFVRNEAMISNLTTFHCLYLTSMFVDADVLFAYLLTDMAYQIFLDNSRQYGNGLVKFEPNDLNKSKVVDLGMLPESKKAEIKQLYKEYKLEENKDYIKRIEQILLSVYAK